MVFTLHRYLFRELIRVFIFASAAMTLMVSTMMILRPLQKYGIGPEQAMHLYGYFLPITLTFVLPLGAMFAAALVYGRFSSDNELDACRASGIGLMTLIYPGLCLAMAVAITSLILSFYVVPSFVLRAEKSIKANAKQILFRNIQRKGFCALDEGGYRVYADHAIPGENILQGTVMIESKNSTVDKLITTEQALVEIEDGKNVNQVTVVASQYYQIDEYGSQANAGKLAVSSPFPSLLNDDIKFQKINRIKEIKNDMMQFRPIEQFALEARAQLASEMLAQDINKQLQNAEDSHYKLANENRSFIFTAKSCLTTGKTKIKLQGPITLFELDKVQGQLICKYDSNEGFIKFSNENENIALEMILENPKWDRGQNVSGVAGRKVIRDMPLPKLIEMEVSMEGLLNTLESTPELLHGNVSEALTGKLAKLKRKIWLTNKSILSEVHSRLVFGLGCITIVMISIALGIKFKGGHLLSAFGASAIPAGALVVFMMSGKQLTTTYNESVPEITGILIMWSGLVLLSVIALWVYRKMLKT